jgi:hypothetical protein
LLDARGVITCKSSLVEYDNLREIGPQNEQIDRCIKENLQLEIEVRLNVCKTKYGGIYCIYMMDSNTHAYQVMALKGYINVTVC